ncbi:hypothetical protein OsccyDRAFT_3866 [Leptolyngbyaceae cyanobacterium JSC-12]|nr:hypothetical protein OsccyDRAFT_3866 [Leptolyngbyaceae cyanobacterium JSC-12]
MYSHTYYLVRSKVDGQYLVAHLRQDETSASKGNSGYLLMFQEHFDALSYLNTHGKDIADRFAVESIPGSQLEALIKRWDFGGVGIVQDPLLPKVEFLARGC